MSTAEKYIPHYTWEDYQNWEGDWELWRGIPVPMSPAARPRHQQVAAALVRQLGNSIAAALSCRRCVVLHETDWKVAADTVVRPDVLVTCDPLPELRIESVPVFVAEILLPATADKDRTAKRRLFAAEGVRYYAMLDPDSGSAELIELAGGDYRPMSGPPFRLVFGPDCSIEIDLSAALAG